MATPSITQNPKTSTAKDGSPLSFIFIANEMIVQCIASCDDENAVKELLKPVQDNYRIISDGKHAALVRRKESNQYWITSILYAETLNKDIYAIISKTTKTMANPTVKGPVLVEATENHKVTKVHIRRPRNQFIIYRQWMSARIHAENPGMTAIWISQVVSQMWRAEKPEVKAHFKALADEEDRQHKLKYPGYRFEAGRRNPQLPVRKRHYTHDPMAVAEKMVAAGF